MYLSADELLGHCEGATPLDGDCTSQYSQKDCVGWTVDRTRSIEEASAACCGEAQSLEVEYHEGKRRRRRGLGTNGAVCKYHSRMAPLSLSLDEDTAAELVLDH